MKRKTIKIEEIKNYFQSILDSPYVLQSEKKIVCNMYEFFLHKSGNYNGWNNEYWWNKGCIEWNEDGCPRDDDGLPLKEYFGSEYNRIYF